MPLTKIDVARRQLVTAIRLFFDCGDSVSVFSLAANAWEVIDTLCNKANVSSLSNQTREYVPKGADLKFNYINSPYRNFFKHADRDPDGVLPAFEESAVDSIIFLGVEDYIRLVRRSPLEIQVFQLWYLATNPQKLSAESLKEILESLEFAFPKICELPRREQILMGRKVLDDALKDDELVKDSRTEAVF